MQVRPVVLVAALLLPTLACAQEGEDPLGSATTSTSTSTTTTRPSATTTIPPTTTTTVALPEPVPVQWSECGGGMECGSVAVPVSYQDPTGPTIELALVKNPADHPDERIGTLVMNPGGPGASGVRRVARGFQISPEVADRFDIVGFDPRGIGQSTPISCGGESVEAFRATDLAPDSPDEEATLEAAAQAVADDCAATEGERLGHYGSVEVAHDIEVIRRSLGEHTISFVGLSYGTLLGQLWAEWYPGSVQALVLDSVVDPGSNGDPGSVTQARGIDASFGSMDAACSAAPDCPLAGGLASGYDELARRIEAGSVSGRGVGPTQLAYAVFWATYDQETWPVLWSAVADGLDGDLAGIADLAGSFTRLVAYAPFALVSCLDGSHPVGFEDWEAGTTAVVEASPRFGAVLANELLPCAFWPQGTLEPIDVTAPGTPPILVVGSTGDAVTPYKTAVAVAERLDSGVLLTVDLDGHIAIGDSDCADTAVTRYLIDLAVPATGARC